MGLCFNNETNLHQPAGKRKFTTAKCGLNEMKCGVLQMKRSIEIDF